MWQRKEFDKKYKIVKDSDLSKHDKIVAFISGPYGLLTMVVEKPKQPSPFSFYSKRK